MKRENSDAWLQALASPPGSIGPLYAIRRFERVLFSKHILDSSQPRGSGFFMKIPPILSGTLRQIVLLPARRHAGPVILDTPTAIYHEVANHALPRNPYLSLLARSGLSEALQGAEKEARRLALMRQPQPFYIAVWDKVNPKKLLGLASGVHLGEYAFLANLAVDKAHQNQGVGSKLVDLFLQKARKMAGGETSVMSLSTASSLDPEGRLKNASHIFATNRGAQPLRNALFWKRQTPFLPPKTS